MADDTFPCVICKREFRRMWPDMTTNQAGGCASSFYFDSRINNNTIVGGYGSYVADFYVFRVLDHTLRDMAGDVCDECILKLYERGKIVYERSIEGIQPSFSLKQSREFYEERKAAGEVDLVEKGDES